MDVDEEENMSESTLVFFPSFLSMSNSFYFLSNARLYFCFPLFCPHAFPCMSSSSPALMCNQCENILLAYISKYECASPAFYKT